MPDRRQQTNMGVFRHADRLWGMCVARRGLCGFSWVTSPTASKARLTALFWGNNSKGFDSYTFSNQPIHQVLLKHFYRKNL